MIEFFFCLKEAFKYCNSRPPIFFYNSSGLNDMLLNQTLSFSVNILLSGLIWFIMPILMVVINDVMAYMFGFFMGRTPLIKLSPKKTWEVKVEKFL